MISVKLNIYISVALIALTYYVIVSNSNCMHVCIITLESKLKALLGTYSCLLTLDTHSSLASLGRWIHKLVSPANEHCGPGQHRCHM